MNSKIVLAKNFKVDLLKFGDVNKNSMGGKVVYMNNDGNKKVTLQTPMLSAPFGIGVWTDDSTGAQKFSIDISFKGKDEDDKINNFYEIMKSIDEKLVDMGVENSKEWFGKKMKKEVVEELYRPLIKQSKEPEKYAPTMKLKLQSNTKGDITCEIFDHNKLKTSSDAITNGSKIQVIIECASVWFVNKQFGITWRALIIRVAKAEKITGFSFIQDDDESEEDVTDEEEIVEADEDPN
jgi:hypothetical protein